MSVESALEVVRVNGWPVFPCNPTNKRPYTLHGFKDASTDSDVIKRWWKQWPSALIGVPMGEPSGVFCVDLDRKENGSDGISTWAKLINEHGKIEPTREHTTPSTGKHLLFTWREGIRNIPLDKLAPGIEVKGDGGYIIVPPGSLPNGKSYSGNNANVSRPPEWLLEMLLAYYFERTSDFDSDFDQEINCDVGKGIHKEDREPVSEDEIREALNGMPSDKYDDWFLVAGAIRRELGDRGYFLFEEWSRKSSKFNPADCQKKWDDAPDINRTTAGTIFFLADQYDPGWRDRLRRKQNDWRDKKESKQEHQKSKGNGNGQDQQPPQQHIKLLQYINYSKWDSVPATEQEWAVHDRFPLREVCLFTGDGAAGKSLLQLQLSVAHVMGGQWLGIVPRQGNVIFFDAEDPEDVLHRRLEYIVKHYRTRFDKLWGKLHLYSMKGKDAVLASVNSRTNMLIKTPLYDELLQMCGDLKPVMIGIASSADVFAGNEIDRSHVRQFITLLTRLAMVANGTVNLIAHPSLTGMSTETGISGNTAWHNSVRARAYMKKIGEETNSVREIQFKKNNYGPVSSSLLLQYQKGLFLPVTMENGEASSRITIAKEVFISLLTRFGENRPVGENTGKSYAPQIFEQEKEAKDVGLDKKILGDAMRELLAEGAIESVAYGRVNSRPNYRLAVTAKAAKQKAHQKEAQEDMPF